MFRYSKFDLITKSNKKTKFILKFIINIIIIIFIIIIFLINIDTKDNVKIISSNSRRIINNLHNYTETMSNFIASGSNYNNNNNNDNDIEQLNEIKNIRLTINYFKELKEQELKEIKLKELKEKELKEQQELKEIKLKEKELKEKEIKEKKEKAINLIKSYVIDYYNSYIHLVPSYSKITGYADNNDCLKELIRINNDELFNKLIKIDYEKSEVSFNYLHENDEYYKNTNNIIETHIYNNYDENNIYYNYSHYIYKNFKENIIKNPLYQIIKDQLEIDYSYTIKNRTDEYNDKSRYFSRSLNDFSKFYNNEQIYFKEYNYKLDKYYELYEDDIYYLYLKSIDSNYWCEWNIFYEFLIENKIIINNPNPIDIYNKHPYKYMCNIPSKPLIIDIPIIKTDYYNGRTYFTAHKQDNIYIEKPIITNINDLENALNIDYHLYKESYYFTNGANQNINTYYGNVNIINFNNYLYDLEANKGSRMIKHNLTNNIPSYNIFEYNSKKIYGNGFTIYNHYFIEKVFIDFPLITIYDEYDYIKQILSNIANIYELPIIPPIKFN
jgi:hypothetical protein